MEGKGPSQIAALLEKEKMLNSTVYKQREGRKTPHQTPENEYRWHESTVAYILEYMEYTGCTVNFRTYTNSIWDKKQKDHPMENRKIFYTPIRRLFHWKSLTRCKKSDSSGIAERQQARAICSPAWCSVTPVNRSSITPPLTTLRKDMTSLSAPLIAQTRTSVAVIIPVPLCSNKRSGNTFKRSYR